MQDTSRLRLTREQLEMQYDCDALIRKQRLRHEATEAATRRCSCVSDKSTQVVDEGIRLKTCQECGRRWYEWISIEEM